MYKYFDNKLKKQTVNLAPGEYYVSGEDIIINTVLGSCVAVALYDPKLRVAGLNHFMLAESRTNPDTDSFFQVERYGLYAMEAVLNGLMKLGSRKNGLQAKIFGGSSVLETGNTLDIGFDNINFAEKFLEAEKIPILNRDTGGNRARRIYLFPQSFRILLRRIQPSDELSRMMESYKDRLDKGDVNGEAVIF